MKHKLVILFMIFLTFIIFIPLRAQNPDDNESLNNLEDFLRLAALNNAALKAGFEQWKAAVEQVTQARSLPDPMFTYGYFIKEVETRVGPQRQKFEIMQTFPWFGVLEAREDEAAALAKAAYQRYETEKLKLFHEVKQAFYEYTFLAQAIKITEENLQLLIHFEEITRTRYATATASHPDIIRVQIEMALLEDRLKSLTELRPALAARLNALVNRPSQLPLPWPASPPYQDISIEPQTLHQLLVKHNPQLQTLQFEIESAGYREIVAQKREYPNIGIGLSYIDTGSAVMPNVDDSGQDPIMAMITLSLPIWSDKNKAAQRQAQAGRLQKTHQKNQLENDLAARIQKIFYEFQDTNRKIKLYQDTIIPKTREMLTASETAYQAGSIDFLSLIDAQRLLLRYQLEYENALATSGQKLAELEMLAGTELNQTELPSEKK
ncbi:MAG: TolC family protein [Sedimentisphaerales bacterium]|nr:TolC family protein [Sedimentisphaerales bacterium]